MFYSCPHCRDLVATDRETRLPPVLCPRCGGSLREADSKETVPGSPASGTPSFASFLRGGNTDAPAAEEVVEDESRNAPAIPEDTFVVLSEEASDAPLGAVDQAPAVEADVAEAAPVVAAEPAPAADVFSPGHAPSFTRTTASATSAHAAKWQWAALFALAALLLVQVLVADRARLAAEAGWRPMITTLCDALRCAVPAWHQPSAIAMLSRDVSPLAGGNGGLDVRATFRNDARWSQPWPVLLLSLSDADGHVLGSRAFLPREYLGPDATQTELAPGQSARIALQLHEPDPGVVAFSFDFR